MSQLQNIIHDSTAKHMSRTHHARACKLILMAAWFAAMFVPAELTHAGVIVNFKGRITSISASGSVDAINPYLAVNDQFTGSFVYDTTVLGTPLSTIGNVGTWKQYSSAITDFSLVFTSGNSTGFSIEGNVPGLSSMSIANDIKNSSSDTTLTDITSGVIQSTSGEFRPGLSKRNFVYRFWDWDANMFPTAELSGWNASNVFANQDFSSNELAFNSSTTGFAQIAQVKFSEFSTASISSVPEPNSVFVWGFGTAVVSLIGRRRVKR